MFGNVKVAIVTIRNDFRHYQGQKDQTSFNKRLSGFLHPNLKSPIFIIGSPRSGTSFLGNCIASLPGVSYHREPVATKFAVDRVYSRDWDFQEAEAYYRRVYGWLMRIHFDGHLRFAEKTPSNCFIIDFLWQAFPDAKFIHLIRDGRDTTLSLSKKRWLQSSPAKSKSRDFEPQGQEAGGYQRVWGEEERAEEFETTSVTHRCIWSWRHYVEAALKGLEPIPDDQKQEIRYETLVTEPMLTADRIIDFLGYADSLTARQELRKAMAVARPDSVGLWKSAFDEGQLAQISQEAGALLTRLNYSDA